MSDYKYEIQEIADEMAEEQFGKDLYELPPEIQCRIYGKAMQEWHDRQAGKAESLEDR